jgi:hypothetical protein
MRFQNIYQTNADYTKSWEKLSAHPGIERTYESRKGHFCFKFKGVNLIAELMATGKLLVYYRSERDKKTYYPLLKEVLMTRDGSPVKICPLYTSIDMIPFPTPRNFKLVWCEHEDEYFKKGTDPWIWVLAPLTTGLFLLNVSK